MYCKVSTQYKLIFGALTLMVGHQEEHLACKIEDGVLVCLSVCSKVQIVCIIVQLLPLHPNPAHLWPLRTCAI